MGSRRLLVGLLAAVALAAGCVPTTGSVHRVGAVSGDGPLAGQGIRVLAQPPAAGASPEVLTRQFLLACADPDDDFAVARSFLAPTVRARWQPRGPVTVYQGDPGDLQITRGANEVTATGQAVASVRSGDYQLADPAAVTTLRLGLTRLDGQWRFRDVPDGLFLASSLLFAFKPVDAYFLDPSGRRLVPDRVFLLASRGELPNAVIRAVLDGPSPWLRGAVRSAIPAGTRLRAPARVRSGVLGVDLDLPPGRVDRPALAAQILWSAAQLPEVSAVRLRLDGTTYEPGGSPLLRANPDASAYDPNALPSTSPGYFVVLGGQRGELRTTEGTSWAFTGDRGPLRHPAVALDRAAVAGLGCAAGSCHSLYLGRLPGGYRRALTVAGALTPPTWDSVTEAVWTVENRPRRMPVVRAVAPDGRAQPVTAPGLTGQVVAIRLARDGARVALVVRTGGGVSVLAGAVVRVGAAVRVERLKPIAPTLAGAVDIGWGDAGHLFVLARSAKVEGSVVTPYRVRVDGSEEPQPVLGTAPGGPPVSLAAAPGHPLLVATTTPGGGAGTRVSALENQTWTLLGPGADPAYPG